MPYKVNNQANLKQRYCIVHYLRLRDAVDHIRYYELNHIN